MNAFRPPAKPIPVLCDALVPMSKLWLLCPLAQRVALCGVADLAEKDYGAWVTEPWVCIPADMQVRLLQVFGVSGVAAERPTVASTPRIVVTPPSAARGVQGGLHTRPR